MSRSKSAVPIPRLSTGLNDVQRHTGTDRRLGTLRTRQSRRRNDSRRLAAFRNEAIVDRFRSRRQQHANRLGIFAEAARIENDESASIKSIATMAQLETLRCERSRHS